jgi:hypothetical protein
VRRRTAWIGGSVIAASTVLAAIQVISRAPAHPTEPSSGSPAPHRLRWSAGARTVALQRAALWHPAIAEAGRASLGNVDHAAATPLVCRFRAEALGGTTPKFECVTQTGDPIKVKYTGAEPHGEVAASRLVRAIGFAADEVTFVERVRCHGCPVFPFLTMKVLGLIDAPEVYGRWVDYAEYRDIAWAAVERKHPGIEIETADGRGWAWFELDRLDAPAAHIDALRLLAMFLAHWDNKAENQRLICLDDDVSGDGQERCTTSMALVQDLGATFGPRKVNLRKWRHTPVWTDRASCLVSMEDLPHGGGTFAPVHISEAGRRFLADRLGELTRAHVRALFESARFPQHDGEPVEAWVDAFEDKVREISEGPPCPAR